MTKFFREKKKLNTYNVIIFNTESYFRDKNYLIPKICIAAIKAKKYGKKTYFGNLDISREWNWSDEQVIYLMKFVILFFNCYFFGKICGKFVSLNFKY